jgi:hypothetical protein
MKLSRPNGSEIRPSPVERLEIAFVWFGWHALAFSCLSLLCRVAFASFDFAVLPSLTGHLRLPGKNFAACSGLAFSSKIHD